MVFTYTIPVDMGYIDEEEQKYLQEVENVKQWWSDTRWRYTKRPFTAEQIVQKRGNVKIEYPSNVQAKKLWRIVEDRFKVSLSCTLCGVFGLILPSLEQTSFLHLRLPRTNYAYPNGEIP
jgi:isocitrate lyase